MPAFSRERLRINGGLFAFLGLLIALTLAGGSSMVSEPGQMAAQFAAIATGTTAIIMRLHRGGRALRAPFCLLAGFAVTMALQLVPLPPALWSALPNREIFAGVARLIGDSASWRPISVTPDATISALLGLLPAFAALVALSTVPRNGIWVVLHALAACILVSALLGLGQIIAGDHGLYFYRAADYGIAAGIFSNRNHAALFDALGFPLIAVLLCRLHANGQHPPRFGVLAMAGGVAVLLLIANVATGSRAGLLTGLVGIAASGTLLAPMLRRWLRRRPPSRRSTILLIVAGAVALLAIAGLLVDNRWASFERLRSLAISSDGRVVLLAPNLALARAYFPVGAGFGSFPQIFRIVEPFGNLNLTYLNHAHNDWLEVVIEGGLVAVAGIVAAMIWLVDRIVALRSVADDGERGYGWLGVIWIAMMLIASLFDYPLRTPMFSVVWILAMALIVIACTPSRTIPPTGSRRA